MARIVFCEYLKKEAEGLDFQLYPGELGKRIFDSVSKQAWSEWIKKQTMLVNEKKLNMKVKMFILKAMFHHQISYLSYNEKIFIIGIFAFFVCL